MSTPSKISRASQDPPVDREDYGPMLEYEKAHTFPASLPFWDETGVAMLESGLKDHASRLRGRSWWIYVHVPFCLYDCAFCFYHKSIDGNVQRTEAYLNHLEIEFRAARTRFAGGRRLPAHSLYVGGGTPTALDEPQFKRLFEIIFEHIEPRVSAHEPFESTVECCPRSLLAPQRNGQWVTLPEGFQCKVEILKRRNISRVSMGIQSLDPEDLDRFGRRHTPLQALQAFDTLVSARIPVINIDLMYGYPGDTVERMKNRLKSTLDALHAGDRDRLPGSVTLYYTRHVPGTRLTWTTDDRAQESARHDRASYKLAYHEVLNGFGYEEYRSHMYRRPAQLAPAVHRYRGAPTLDTARWGMQLGFGPSAFSHVADRVARNAWPLERWMDLLLKPGRAGPAVAIGKRLSLSEQQSRFLIKELLCKGPNEEANAEGFRQEFHTTVQDAFRRPLAVLRAEGWLDPGHLKLTDEGRKRDELVAYRLYPVRSLESGALALSGEVASVMQEVRRKFKDQGWARDLLAAIEDPDGFLGDEGEYAVRMLRFWELLRPGRTEAGYLSLSDSAVRPNRSERLDA